MIDVSSIDLLCLDAGNVVIFLDHARMARMVPGSDEKTIIRVEGEAKKLAETGELVDVEWKFKEKPGAPGWGRMVGTIAHLAGLPRDRVPTFLDAAWEDHVKLNLWCVVPQGFGESIDAMRAKGVKVALISNSEGMLDALFVQLGIRDHFDLLVDSGVAGVEKPDAKIFEIALNEFEADRSRTLHLGDTFTTDILGAQNAGIRYALIDPFDHYAGRHPEVPRAPGVVEVARAITAARQ